MFPSSCQQLPTIQWSPIPSAIFFRIFGGCSTLMARNVATGGPTSPTVLTGLHTVSGLPISPRNCRSYRRRTRIGSWDAPLSRDSTGPRSNASGTSQDRQDAESAQGLVSRVSPVQTALRNCTRDEGRSFEVGNQVLISSDRKLLLSKAMVVNVAETSGQDSGRHD